LHNFSLQEPYAMPYTNRIPSIFETLRDEQEHSFLFRFVADPPTTTMQVRDFEKKTIFRCDFPLRSIDRRALNFSNRKS
jgi:hypothetical protein